MSSCSIIQERNRFTIGVDTATSCLYNETIYRVRDIKSEKLSLIGNDVVFLSGYRSVTEPVRHKLEEFLNDEKHINILALQDYLRKEYPFKEEFEVHSQISVDILSFKSGITSFAGMTQTYNNYEIYRVVTPPIKTMNVVTSGFQKDFLYEKIMEYNKTRFDLTGKYNIFEDVLDTYRHHYCEGIGNEIFMYSFDESGLKLLHSEKLLEIGLRYVNPGQNIMPDGQTAYIHLISDGHSPGGTPIHSNNIGNQRVLQAASADFAPNAGNSLTAKSADYAFALQSGGYGYGIVYVSANNNLRPQTDSGSSSGTSDGRWSSVWAASGVIQTSDVNRKNSIEVIGDKYLQLAKMLIPKSYKMNDGTSGRTHVGFIAQDIEAAMTECGISDMEFAGLIKAPVYSKKLLDKDGNELQEYDTESEIIGYDYCLRYDEFIPLLLARIIDLEEKLKVIEVRV